jgi:hypothetical protein
VYHFEESVLPVEEYYHGGDGNGGDSQFITAPCPVVVMDYGQLKLLLRMAEPCGTVTDIFGAGLMACERSVEEGDRSAQVATAATATPPAGNISGDHTLRLCSFSL